MCNLMKLVYRLSKPLLSSVDYLQLVKFGFSDVHVLRKYEDTYCYVNALPDFESLLYLLDFFFDFALFLLCPLPA